MMMNKKEGINKTIKIMLVIGIILGILILNVVGTIIEKPSNISTTESTLLINLSDNWIRTHNISVVDINVTGTITLAGTLLVVSSGTEENAYNGSWIAHDLPSDPNGNGSITLSLRGSSSLDATHILRVPTVISSNSTHFQIEFLMWNSTDWKLYPVLVGDAQTLYWDAVYRG